ncbi:MAG: hypothetical protein LBR56_08580 [Sporomusaceae bacterium]|nr:hypothetical protein [Sporomusaceae bacterium]
MPNPKKLQAEKIIKALLAKGHAAFFVGGCVRDMMLERESEDFDIATSATAAEIKEVTKKRKWQTLLVGQQFSVIMVILKGEKYEVASFRTDTYGTADRRPVSVEAVESIEEDLARRDFTINAMAMDLEGRIIDPFGGRADLEKKMIRAVGNANERFGEDALRMFRAIRFAARFNFKIAPDTFTAIGKNLTGLSTLSAERVANELTKIITAQYPLVGIRLLLKSGLASQTCRGRNNKKDLVVPVLPELKFLPREGAGKLALLTNTPPHLTLRLAALFVLMAKAAPLDTAAVLARLKVKAAARKTILWLIKNFPYMPPLETTKAWLGDLAQDFSSLQDLRRHLFYLLLLWRSKGKSAPDRHSLRELKVLMTAIKQTLKTIPFFVGQLAISGEEIAAHLGANAKIKKFQRQALFKIQEGVLENTTAGLRQELILFK